MQIYGVYAIGLCLGMKNSEYWRIILLELSFELFWRVISSKLTLKYYNSIIGLSLVVNKTFMVDEIVCFKNSKSHCQIVEMHNYYLWSTGWK
jgi:hypothetical protein